MPLSSTRSRTSIRLEPPDADRQEHDFVARNLDVTSDDESFVEYAIENIDETAGP